MAGASTTIGEPATQLKAARAEGRLEAHATWHLSFDLFFMYYTNCSVDFRHVFKLACPAGASNLLLVLASCILSSMVGTKMQVASGPPSMSKVRAQAKI